MSELTQSDLHRFLSYDQETGIFRWLVSKPRARAGDVAGYAGGGGYLRVQVAGKSYALHRLAFLYVEGAMPNEEVDHINRDRHDNRFANLRKIAKAANLRNKGVYRNSTSGLTGVYPRGNRYRALIQRDGRRVSLGTFDSIDEAKQAYADAKRVLHPEYFTCQL